MAVGGGSEFGLGVAVGVERGAATVDLCVGGSQESGCRQWFGGCVMVVVRGACGRWWSELVATRLW